MLRLTILIMLALSTPNLHAQSCLAAFRGTLLDGWTLSKHEREVLYAYAQSTHLAVNKALREGRADNVSTIVSILDGAVNQLSVYKGKTYRVVKSRQLTEASYEELVSQYPVGEIIEDLGYVSASSVKDNYFAKMQMTEPQGTKAFRNATMAERRRASGIVTLEIASKTGRSIPHRFSAYGRSGEYEVIFPRGSRFKVYEVTRGKAGEVYIRMHEL